MAYEADEKAHMDRFDDDVEIGLCRDAMRQTMMLKWDFAMMQCGKA